MKQIAAVLLFVVALAVALPAAAQQQNQPFTPNPLAKLLQSKGILTARRSLVDQSGFFA